MSYIKLEPFEGKQTKFCGLWYNAELHRFYSPVFDLAQLKQFKGKVRLMVMKNRYYNGGENGRPNYVFSFCDAKSENPQSLDVEQARNRSKGQWVYTQWLEEFTEVWSYECSECGCTLVDSYCYDRPNFCPNCGTDMKGGDTNGDT